MQTDRSPTRFRPGTLYTVSLADGTVLRELAAHKRQVFSLDLDPEEQRIASTRADGRLLLSTFA